MFCKAKFAACSEILIKHTKFHVITMYEGWNFNSGNYLFTTDTK